MLRLGYSVIGLDLQECPSGPVSRRYEYVTGDIRDGCLVRPLVGRSDVIVNLAGIVGHGACKARPDDAVSINAEAVRQLCGMVDGAQIFLQISTESVYGFTQADLCDESTEPYPASLYAKTKLDAEAYVADVGGLSVRLPSLFGLSPMFRPDLLVHSLVAQGLAEGRIDVYEPGAKRSFLHVSDAVRAMNMLLDHPLPAQGLRINVGDARLNRTKVEVAAVVADHLGVNIATVAGVPDEDARDCTISFDLVRSYGFAAAVSLEDGIAEVATLLSSEVN